MFDAINTAYARTNLILTTNLPYEQLAELPGSERPPGVAEDRLTHRCHNRRQRIQFPAAARENARAALKPCDNVDFSTKIWNEKRKFFLR